MKKLLLGTAIALALGVVTSSAFAATTSSSTWSGGGTFVFSATGANGSTAALNTAGGNINGSATYTNQENNPYAYGVPNTSFNVNATVGNGGMISSSLTRTGSGSGYGAAGQSIVGQVGTSDGTGALVMNASTNYAGMQDVGYGRPTTAGGHTIDASGTAYQINYSVNTGAANNNGGVSVSGSGSASITQQYSGASANGFNLANGGGIYTGANIAASGTGRFVFGGAATSSLTVVGSGNTLPGTVANPASFNGTGTFSGANVSWTNYAISGNN